MQVNGADRATQEGRDVPLEEVGVRDEEAAQLQVHDQGREQRAGQQRVDLDDAQVHPHVPQVVGIREHLPFLAEARELGVAEVEAEGLLEQRFGERSIAPAEDVAADLLDQVVDGAPVREAAPAKEREDLADQQLRALPVGRGEQGEQHRRTCRSAGSCTETSSGWPRT